MKITTLGAALTAALLAMPAQAQDVQPPKPVQQQPAKKQTPKAQPITVWVMEAKGAG